MKRFLNFLKAETGTVSVETVFMFPLLLWGLGATFLFWDMFHARAVSQRAAYTIADTLSRQVDVVDMQFIEGLADIHTYLLQSQHATRIRISTVAWDNEEEEFNVIWSRSPDGWAELTDDTLALRAPQIPDMSQGDVAILVEAQVGWTPFMNVGVGAVNMDSLVVSRPRFAGQIVFENEDGTTIHYGAADT